MSRRAILAGEILEDRFHFSCQFTADLIVMNASDFVITSTSQACKLASNPASLPLEPPLAAEQSISACAPGQRCARVVSQAQEIAGKDDRLGQYESYEAFTLPDLYRVVKASQNFSIITVSGSPPPQAQAMHAC